MLSFALLLATTTVSTPAPVRPGPFRTFGDWAVACDNVVRCSMTSLDPEGRPAPTEVLTLMREPGQRGRWKLWLTARTDEDPFAVQVDGEIAGGPFRATPDGATIEGATALAVVSALTVARKVEIIDGTGRTLARMPTRGLTDGLRYIDQAQGRAGTVTATMARGTQPATDLPDAPDMPVIKVVKPTGHATMPTPAQVRALQRRAKCPRVRHSGSGAQVHPLDAKRALVLVPCRTNGLNPSMAAYLTYRRRTRPARLDFTPGVEGWTRIPRVYNASYKAGSLFSYARKSTVGDCGVSQHFIWDGSAFRLIEQTQMDVCRGNTGFLSTWRVRLRFP